MVNFSSRTLFLWLFALSGFSGLIYESIWSHYLKLFLGHAAYAQTLVLAIFMGGMAIGSWICSRYSSGWKNLLVGYALAEGAIGLMALLFHNVFDLSTQFAYHTILPALGSATMVNAFKWTLASALILPQSILLGMTFPLMSAGIIRWFPNQPGNSVAMLYFSNSIGAAIGVIASGFLLIDLVGLPGTIRVGGVINLLLALTVWYIAKDRPVLLAEKQPETMGEVAKEKNPVLVFLLLVALFTGAASFIYEIGWIRMLSLVLGSSTHAFELMLSAFILGLALGGLWIHKKIDKISNPVLFLAIVQLVMGILALSTLPIYGNTFEVMQWLLKVLDKSDTGYTLFNLSSHAIATIIMVPTTFCAGMTLPLITYTLLRQGVGEKSIGAVYASNTVGAIVGVYFAIHIGLPVLGLKGLLTLGAGIDIVLAFALLLHYTQLKPRPVVIGGFATGTAALLATVFFVHLDPYKMASGVYRTGMLIKPENMEILYHKDGKAATVDLQRDKDGYVNIRTNGKVDANIKMADQGEMSGDEPTMVLAAALPLAFNPQARKAAVIGMGSGLSTHTLLTSNTIEQVDTIEIEPAMVEAANGFRPRVERAYTDSRSHIYIDDAKTFFSAHNRQYDIIVSEPSNPWVSGTASLFTSEFYRLLPQYLSEEGILVQWIQLYELNIELVSTIVKALTPYFSDYAIYFATEHDILLLAKKHGTLDKMSDQIFTADALRNELRLIYVNNNEDLELRRLASKKVLGPLFDTYNVPANSDYYPYLDLRAAKTRFLNTNARELIALSYTVLPVTKLLERKLPNHAVTDLTRYHTPAKIMFSYVGVSVRNLYLNPDLPPELLPKKYQQTLNEINQYFWECQPVNSGAWIDTLLDFSSVLLPFLTMQELDQIWGRLLNNACWPRLTPQQQDWMTLLQAISLNQPRKMAELATWLLKYGIGINERHFEFLVGTAMLGLILENKPDLAHQVWLQYSGKYHIQSDKNLFMRLLVAHSNMSQSPL